MVVDDGELYGRRVAETIVAIRRDFRAAGRPLPDEPILRKAAGIVVSYPDAWPRYTSLPDDWDGRIAVATLWAWRKICAERVDRSAAA
jgi:hypothetical protein